MIQKIKDLKGYIDCPKCFSLLQWDDIKDIKVFNGNKYIVCPVCGQSLMLDPKKDYWIGEENNKQNNSFNFIRVVTKLPETGDPNYIYAIKYHLYTAYIKDEQAQIDINGDQDLAIVEKEIPNILLQTLFIGLLPDYKLYFNLGTLQIDTNYMLDKESIHYVSTPPAVIEDKHAYLIDKGQFYKTYTYSSSMGWINTNKKEMTFYFEYPGTASEAGITGYLYSDKEHTTKITSGDLELYRTNQIKQYSITYIGNNEEEEIIFYPMNINYSEEHNIYYYSRVGTYNSNTKETISLDIAETTIH